MLAAGAGAFFDAITCTKTPMRCAAAEGAHGYCARSNCVLLNNRVLDWLEERFGLGA